MGNWMMCWGMSCLLAGAMTGCAEAPEAAVASDTLANFEGHALLELESAFPVALGYLSHVRELSDGSVLAADPSAPALVRFDFHAGTLDTLGREGDGPEEYRQPDLVLPLPADTTLMVDLGKLRFAVVAPNGSLVDGMPMASEVSASQRGMPLIVQPRHADRQGMLYYQGNRLGRNALPDSAAVVRVDRGTQRHDTVALVWMPPLRREASGRAMEVLLEGVDDWAVAPDGSVAIVRANGYRVEWIFPDGRRVMGPEYPVASYPVDDAEKVAALDEMAVTGSQMQMLTGGGGIRMRMNRGIPREGLSVDRYQWADALPAFMNYSARISPRNELWVERVRPLGEPRVADVFDTTGTRLGEVDLPEGRRLVGFGSSGEVAYLVRTDDYGLKWLERYRVRYSS